MDFGPPSFGGPRRAPSAPRPKRAAAYASAIIKLLQAHGQWFKYSLSRDANPPTKLTYIYNTLVWETSTATWWSSQLSHDHRT
jgi:hypothetical protein